VDDGQHDDELQTIRETKMSTSAAGTIIFPSERKDGGSDPEQLGPGETLELNDSRCPTCGRAGQLGATSAVSAEAEQGDGPAAASATSSAVADGIADTSAVSVVAAPNYAAAACDFGVVAVGPFGASAASEVGVAAVGPSGAAATSNAANSSSVAVNGNGKATIEEPSESDE
jgi:hypothetical protein